MLGCILSFVDAIKNEKIYLKKMYADDTEHQNLGQCISVLNEL